MSKPIDELVIQIRADTKKLQKDLDQIKGKLNTTGAVGGAAFGAVGGASGALGGFGKIAGGLLGFSGGNKTTNKTSITGQTINIVSERNKITRGRTVGG